VKPARFIILFPLISVLVLSLYLEGGVWRTASYVLAGVSVAGTVGTWIYKQSLR
jgi:hypothetical protein